MKIVVEVVRALPRPVETHLEKVQIATISAHNDASIGPVVANAVERVGKKGVAGGSKGD
jgi:chaperonin GroEL